MMKRRCCRSHDKHVVYLIGSAALNEAPAFLFSAAPRGRQSDSYALPVLGPRARALSGHFASYVYSTTNTIPSDFQRRASLILTSLHLRQSRSAPRRTPGPRASSLFSLDTVHGHPPVFRS